MTVAQGDALDSFPQYKFNHKDLGELIGLARGDDIVQFRGIPFATIAARYRQARLLESLPQQPFDARRPGPYCPQPLLPFPSYWEGALPADFPSLTAPSQDEFNCLNLSITVPRTSVETSSAQGLPVLFFIHGGAFIGGSQSIQLAGREIYDATNLIRASVARGQPIVVVTCNYRVGPLGFLASEELTTFNKKHGEPIGNYGLHDQRQALEWCHKFISGFGGDVENVTIQGTSAGGSSAHYLSTFPARKFKRAILASGTLTGIGPMPMPYQQEKFNAYVSRHSSEKNGFDSDSVALLQSIPVEELVKPVSAGIYHPFIDGDWILGSTMQSVCSVYKEVTVPDLMIGACDFEADLSQLLLVDDIVTMKPAPDSRMRTTIFDLVSSNGMIISPDTFPDAHPTVTDGYNISSSLEHPSSAMYQWADLLADVAFRVPPLHIAAHHPANVLIYGIRCKNPYAGWSWSFGRANHAVNDVFLFDVAPDLMAKDLQTSHAGNVAQIRAAWLDFCYGKLPWAPYRQGDDRLGPMHVFEHGEKGRDAESLEDAVGNKAAGQWRAILDANMP
ncbi:Alpha/Beta hydrolase protein [Phaeosphaeriaceae sp. PMI808]|nr:Alpha/Beta hydrolase protein [Phaeosphaeriaceae sp. PMI808]